VRAEPSTTDQRPITASHMRIGTAAQRAHRHHVIALTDVLPRHVDAHWLPVGVSLQLASQALRSRGWFNSLRASYPDARELRARDVVAASFAGAGVNGIVPARGGELVRLAFVHRRIEGARYVTLAATALPETAFESLCSAALITWLLLAGLMPLPSAEHAPEALLLPLAVLAAGIAVARRMSRRSQHVLNDVRRGLAVCSCPRRFVAQVVGWQAVARLARLGSLLCFLAAFELPATLATALLVMAAQGLRVAVLNYGFVAVSGQPQTPAALSGVHTRDRRAAARRDARDRERPDRARAGNAITMASPPPCARVLRRSRGTPCG
jgi:hypothetical protein